MRGDNSWTILQVDSLREVLGCIGHGRLRYFWLLPFAFILIQVVDDRLELDLGKFLSFVTAAGRHGGAGLDGRRQTAILIVYLFCVEMIRVDDDRLDVHNA